MTRRALARLETSADTTAGVASTKLSPLTFDALVLVRSSSRSPRVFSFLLEGAASVSVTGKGKGHYTVEQVKGRVLEITDLPHPLGEQDLGYSGIVRYSHFAVRRRQTRHSSLAWYQCVTLI